MPAFAGMRGKGCALPFPAHCRTSPRSLPRRRQSTLRMEERGSLNARLRGHERKGLRLAFLRSLPRKRQSSLMEEHEAWMPAFASMSGKVCAWPSSAHCRESGNPALWKSDEAWMPAFAGMSGKVCAWPSSAHCRESGNPALSKSDEAWMPAFAGMSGKVCAWPSSIDCGESANP
jgi:hypothetical protein